MVTLIVPARNEAGCIAECLRALAEQTGLDILPSPPEIIVSVNGSTDATSEIALSFKRHFEGRGIPFLVLESAAAGKACAIRQAERHASFAARAVLDADTVLTPSSLAALIEHITSPEALFVTGQLQIAPTMSRVTRAYGKALLALPHFREGASGAGFYAVTAAGRARWGEFPDLIADDMFVRGHFASTEIRSTGVDYTWPLPTGWTGILHVRRRQEHGLRELETLRPDLLDRRTRLAERLGWLLKTALKHPFTSVVYVMLAISCRVAVPKGRAWEPAR